jgi:hypothetical protein
LIVQVQQLLVQVVNLFRAVELMVLNVQAALFLVVQMVGFQIVFLVFRAVWLEVSS